MRTTKIVAITMPPAMAKEAARLAKKQNRTMSELMREAFRQYQQQEKARPSAAALQELASALAALREDAKRKGLDKLTMREIDAEVSAYRRGPAAGKRHARSPRR
jgi:Arc/MetJ-type ribon-helix-helix transcriptional regulator